MRRSLIALSLLGLLAAGCASDPATSQEYQTLQQQLADTQQQLAGTKQQLADVQQQLADAAAERDALANAAAQSTGRHDKAKATQEALQAILDDPASVGTGWEVVDALTAHYTPGAMMVDDVFGSIDVRRGWYYTLYGDMAESVFDGGYSWLSEDGSQGGSVWLWHGTNQAGNPFKLAGVSLDDFNEEGLVSREFVVYPYADDYVREAIEGAGT